MSQRSPDAEPWPLKSEFRLGLYFMLAGAAATVALLAANRLFERTGDPRVSPWFAWVFAGIIVVPYAYRRGVRDGREHPTPSDGTPARRRQGEERSSRERDSDADDR